MRAALYVHIPFCARKCAYCDFESYAGRLSLADEYIERVLGEARRAREEYGPLGVPSVYIGGGTPSLLSPRQIARLLRGLEGAFQLEKGVEISMEVNPGTVTAQKLEAARSAGINRLSIGAQASQPRLLQMLGRIHLWPDVADAVRRARDAGFENINLDLMYALPGQSARDFLDALDAALALSPEHISCYSLILEEGTPLFDSVNAGILSRPDDESSVDMQALAIERLRQSGLARYEISNYSLPGFACRHNIAYWTRESYLGLGCAAHSLMNETRFANPNFDGYMAGERRADAEAISLSSAMEETVMLETRMTRGIDLRAFCARFSRERLQTLVSRARPLEAGGLVVLQNGFLALTDAGMNVQNAVVLRLIS